MASETPRYRSWNFATFNCVCEYICVYTVYTQDLYSIHYFHLSACLFVCTCVCVFISVCARECVYPVRSSREAPWRHRLSGGSAGRLSGGSLGECLSVSTICTLQQLSVIPCSLSQPITPHRPRTQPLSSHLPALPDPARPYPRSVEGSLDIKRLACASVCLPSWSYLINFCSEETLKGEREEKKKKEL